MNTYVCIDLKSFYASVECMERGLDPLNTNLVVADKTRTNKTICLAVSPSLKSYGLGGRARLYEVEQKVKEINTRRLKSANLSRFSKKSYIDSVVKENKNCALSYIVATPRMAFYMKYSANIYSIYLKYVSEDDIHVYSIDEVFIDVTKYLKIYNKTAREFALMMIKDVYQTTGITATCGVGTNLYLSKIAMDIVAKHIDPDEDGVRIAELNEKTYREKLWDYKPLTDFWRIGNGISRRLNNLGIYTQGDIARCAVENEDILYDEFGINAELIIDHAFGFESCTLNAIKSYVPVGKSLSSGQVLKKPYSYEKVKTILKEMTDSLVLDLVESKLVCDQMVLTIVYDVENIKKYDVDDVKDVYGRKMPKPSHGSINLNGYTNSLLIINENVLKLYERIVDKNLSIRRVYIVANHLIYEKNMKDTNNKEQLNLFVDYKEIEKKRKEKEKLLSKEKKMQSAIIKIKNKYGKNAIVKGHSLEEDATGIERNQSIGGHKA